MNKLNLLLDRASSSRFYLWVLNRLLWRMVPFNAPHGLRLSHVTPDSLTVELPYRRSNLNHIKGIHACALASLCEYVCGLQLMNALGASSYRLIMKTMHMKYFYQAKSPIAVTFGTSREWLEQHVTIPLAQNDSTEVDLSVKIYDLDQKEICQGLVTWQIKHWSKVRTKV